jgi:Na+/proline symporter
VTVQAGTLTEVLKRSTDASPRGIIWIQRLMVLNLVLVALQPVSAGLFLSGYGSRAVAVHAGVALALQFGALVQAVTAVVLWRRRRIPGSLAGFSAGLLVLVALEIGAGYSGRYWLHVPLGVGMFGGLVRRVNTPGITRGQA